MTRGSLLSAAASVLVAAVVLPAAPASAAPAYPQPDGRCVDRTAVLGAALCNRITAVLLNDEKDSRDEIAVAVVPTTGDASIESWSTGLFDAWGVGKAGEDNGVLLVVAVDDHRVRLETGRGISARLSDVGAQGIVDSVITLRFGAGEYRTGILDGLDEVRRQLGHPLDESLADLDSPDATTDTTAAAAVDVPYPDSGGDIDDGGLGAPGWFIVALIVIVFGILVTTVRTGGSSSRPAASSGPGSAAARRQRRLHDDGRSSAFFYGAGGSGSSWSGGGDSGGGSSGSSFGGGSSDGGGSSGSW